MRLSTLFAVALTVLALSTVASAQGFTSLRQGGTQSSSIPFNDYGSRAEPTQRLGVVNPYTGDSSYFYYNRNGDPTRYSYRGYGGYNMTNQRLYNYYRRRSHR